MTGSGELPEGWAEIALGEVSEIRSGYGFPRELQGRTSGDVPFYKVKDISRAWQANEMYVQAADDYITSDEARSLGAEALRPETTVFAKIGEAIKLNRRAMLAEPALVDNNVMGVWPRPGILDSRYLHYFSRTLRFGDSARASVVPSIRKSDVEAVQIRLAPLAEQHRVVAKIEELLSDLDAGVAALKRVQANLARYKASVLKAAVEGRLTEQWREEHPDVEPASILLERIRRERRARWEEEQLAKCETKGQKPPKGWREKYREPEGLDTALLPELPDRWCWVSVGQVSDIQSGIQKQPSRAPRENAHPYLRVANVLMNRLDLREIEYFELLSGELERLRLEPGDLLVVEGNGSRDQIGRSALWAGEISDCVHQNHIIRVRARTIEPTYLNLYWNSPGGRSRTIEVAASTSGLYTLSAGKVGALPLPMPPQEEQNAIVEVVDGMLEAVLQGENAVRGGLVRSTKTRQSILARAFSGKLVSQDPADEPASVLLDRIRAEREAEASEKPAHRRRASKKSTEQQESFSFSPVTSPDQE